MNRCSRPFGGVLVGVGLALLAFELPAMAADLPLKAPAAKTVYDWTGFYLAAMSDMAAVVSARAPIPCPNKACSFRTASLV